jgi:hypothetical protein
MQPPVFLLFWVASILAVQQPPGALAQNPDIPQSGANFASTHILVRFKPGTASARSATLSGHHTLPGLTKASVGANETVEDAIVRVKSDPDVAFAEPDYYVYPLVVPNDPLYGYIWSMPAANAE